MCVCICVLWGVGSMLPNVHVAVIPSKQGVWCYLV